MKTARMTTWLHGEIRKPLNKTIGLKMSCGSFTGGYSMCWTISFLEFTPMNSSMLPHITLHKALNVCFDTSFCITLLIKTNQQRYQWQVVAS